MNKGESSLYIEWADYNKTVNKTNIVMSLVRLGISWRVFWIMKKNKVWETEFSLANTPSKIIWKNEWFPMDAGKSLIHKIFWSPFIKPSSDKIKTLVKTLCDKLEIWLTKFSPETGLFLYVSDIVIINWKEIENIISAVELEYLLIETWEIVIPSWQEELQNMNRPLLLN